MLMTLWGDMPHSPLELLPPLAALVICCTSWGHSSVLLNAMTAIRLPFQDCHAWGGNNDRSSSSPNRSFALHCNRLR